MADRPVIFQLLATYEVPADVAEDPGDVRAFIAGSIKEIEESSELGPESVRLVTALGEVPAQHFVTYIATRVHGTGHRTGWSGFAVERRADGRVLVLWTEHELEHPTPDLPAPPWWLPTELLAPDELEVNEQ